ncbi:conserved hypothetical protein [Uncinocarpus reesii 1704]|uniref:Major facilitator superfamily (MFS) profile domain-containing protein n=1 Tax=Uncinocarpus reesii (strain UAMH 1704) TaxID=336963 RepID=C4JDS2_UNCRE|nr:uncharacterized protein UREG_00549 [Uncinocarpus reesii 1704]EEP75702.1 conserved hypothetical protein [Uncinocarpus reesii 1704]
MAVIQEAKSDPASHTSSVTATTAPIPSPPSDPPAPYSAFSPARRRFIIGTVTAVGFFGPLCGAVYLPSLVLFQQIFHTTVTVINASVSVYMAVFAIAVRYTLDIPCPFSQQGLLVRSKERSLTPLFGAAAADYGGRKTVYMFALGSFLISNILLAALPPTLPGLFVLRIFQAFGSCIVTSVGAGTVADIIEPAKRASALAIFLLGPQLGPILGPLIGGQFATLSRWRWVFGFLALTCAPLYVLVLFFLPETLRCLVGNGEIYASSSWFAMPRLRQKPLVDQGRFPKPPKPTVMGFIRLLRYPPHLIVSVNGALSFAGLYAIYVTFPSVWEERYGFSSAEVGYLYLAPGISLLIASVLTGRLSDYRRAKALKAAQQAAGSGSVLPEQRISLQIFGFIISGAGKVLYGWFTAHEIHPSAGLVGSGIAAVGTAIIFVTSTSFQTECDPSQAASLVALAGLVRNIAAAIAAVIIDRIVRSIGYGWCFTGLGILDVACVAGVLLIMWKGQTFRERRLARS